MLTNVEVHLRLKKYVLLRQNQKSWDKILSTVNLNMTMFVFRDI